ncbi:hypothetical protein ACFFKU_16935 [Kineococcus gynurae]|uniref:Lipoprotein n=1 Tax=Kineococcus gynurae TaxID=452979 RepID=A0ABV5LP38_9ACTN
MRARPGLVLLLLVAALPACTAADEAPTGPRSSRAAATPETLARTGGEDAVTPTLTPPGAPCDEVPAAAGEQVAATLTSPPVPSDPATEGWVCLTVLDPVPSWADVDRPGPSEPGGDQGRPLRAPLDEYLAQHPDLARP